MKRLWLVWMVVMLVVSLGLLPALPVKGSGTTTDSFYVADVTHDGYLDSGSSWLTWDNAVNSNIGRVYATEGYTNGIFAGWDCQTLGSTKFILYEAIFGFDVSGIPEGSEIVSSVIKLRSKAKKNEGGWEMYMSIYKGTPGLDHSIDGEDWDNAYDAGAKRIGSIESYDDIAIEEYHSWDILSLNDGLDYISSPDENGYVWVYFASTNHMLNYSPGFQVGFDLRVEFYLTSWGVDHRPILEITYQGAAETRQENIEIPTNTSKGSHEESDEVTSISWITPRTAYSDETIGLDVEGDIGAYVEIELRDEAGIVLDSLSDEVRDNGHYYWSAEVGNNVKGFVRAFEKTDSIYSKWGYAYPMSGSQALNTTMCVDTDVPHNTRSFSDFMVKGGDLMVVHWKTNIDGDTELADHKVDIYHNGYYSDSIYSELLSGLQSSYFECTDGNKDLLHWRYMLFVMDGSGAGFDDYDGLVIDLEQPMGGSTYGFYVPTIYKVSESAELTIAKDAYWYIPKVGDGVAESMVSSSVEGGGKPAVNIRVGDLCEVLGSLNKVLLTIVTPDDDLFNAGADTLEQNSQEFESNVALSEEGDYLLRVELYQGHTSFRYTKDLSFKVGEGGGITEGAGEDILHVLDLFGLDNTVGHWIVLLVLMVGGFILCRKSQILRVVVPLVVLAIAIVMNWIDTWIIVLLALGAGVTIFSLLRKKAVGGG